MFNVLIRPLEIKDALFSWEWRNDSDVWEFTGKRPNKYITLEIESEWIENVLKDYASKRFAILVNDEYVGNIQLTNIIENNTAEYHIFIGNKKYWSKGIATLATNQLIRYAKNILNLKEIYLFVNTNNVSAIKLYEKCNFKKLNDDMKMSLNLLENLAPKLSVFMMVYNHEKYLKEALNGILEQKCNFDFEIVIGEDYSKDQSRNIIINYNEKFPGKFKLLLHKINIGAQKNQKAVLENCTGKFIALCEGDDYWTDPLKLQKQVDFLETNPDYVICYHKVKVLQNGILKEDTITQKAAETTTIKDLAKGNYIHTCSVVFRNNLFDKFPPYFHKSPVGDYFLHMLNARYGKIKFMDECMGVYRLHDTSVWSSKTQVRREQIWRKFLKNIRKNFDEEVKEILDDQIKKYTVLRNKRRMSSLKNYIKRFLF